MENPNLYTLQLKLNRYKLTYHLLENDVIQLGGVKGLKSLKLYYSYLPLIIGLLIVGVGFMIDFILFEACGAVFLLYAAYGSILVQRKIASNKYIKLIRNGEIEITQDNSIATLTLKTIKDFNINIEVVGKETYEGRLTVTDSNNSEYFILGLFDPDKRMLGEDLEYIKEYIKLRLNTTNNG